MLPANPACFLGILFPAAGRKARTHDLFEALSRLRAQPYLIIMPGLTLTLVVLSLQFVGDALNDALNPRSHSR
ncbi:MAG: hypothetical protein IPK17_00200 [Chloroflexi bacterium]|uniref:hypothetical protein n=1 Tax=Candidatus Flexifilum breve TaxID=3140694 RepID=UPI0031375C35|nr:hypothetical protein [Chloroflexota bacterium]